MSLSSPDSSTAPRTSRIGQRAGWAMAVCGGLIVIGSIMPWYTVGGFSFAGTSDDGGFTVFFGVMSTIAGVRRGYATSDSARTVNPIVGVVLAALTVFVAGRMLLRIWDLPTADTGSHLVGVGAGLYVTVVGGLALGIASVVAALRRP